MEHLSTFGKLSSGRLNHERVYSKRILKWPIWKSAFSELLLKPKDPPRVEPYLFKLFRAFKGFGETKSLSPKSWVGTHRKHPKVSIYPVNILHPMRPEGHLGVELNLLRGFWCIVEQFRKLALVPQIMSKANNKVIHILQLRILNLIRPYSSRKTIPGWSYTYLGIFRALGQFGKIGSSSPNHGHRYTEIIPKSLTPRHTSNGFSQVIPVSGYLGQ